MQAVVRFAFTRDQRSVLVYDLLEQRDAESFPQGLALLQGEQRLSSTRKTNHGVGHGRRRIGQEGKLPLGRRNGLRCEVRRPASPTLPKNSDIARGLK